MVGAGYPPRSCIADLRIHLRTLDRSCFERRSISCIHVFAARYSRYSMRQAQARFAAYISTTDADLNFGHCSDFPLAHESLRGPIAAANFISRDWGQLAEMRYDPARKDRFKTLMPDNQCSSCCRWRPCDTESREGQSTFALYRLKRRTGLAAAHDC